MSLEQLRRAWAAPVESPAERSVLLALADAANDDGGQCYPSQATLSRLAAISERHVRTVLRDLMARGLLTISRPSTSHSTTGYQLSLPELTSGNSVPPDRKPVPTYTGTANGSGRNWTRPLPETSSADPSESLRDPKSASAHAREGALLAQTSNGVDQTTDQQEANLSPHDRERLARIRAARRPEPPLTHPELAEERRQRAERARSAENDNLPKSDRPAPRGG